VDSGTNEMLSFKEIFMNSTFYINLITQAGLSSPVADYLLGKGIADSSQTWTTKIYCTDCTVSLGLLDLIPKILHVPANQYVLEMFCYVRPVNYCNFIVLNVTTCFPIKSVRWFTMFLLGIIPQALLLG